jgi:hypothetical protein
VKINFLPKTALGKWSVGLIAGMIVFYQLFRLLIASGQRGGDTFFSNLALAIPVLFAGISGISAFFTGIHGIIKSKERSVIVYLVTIIGFIVLFFILGEVIFPH